jgi:predicted DNA-binding transcriptional regulator AlpA
MTLTGRSGSPAFFCGRSRRRKAMDSRLLGRKEVLHKLSISSATLHRGMLEGRFPKPYQLGQSRVAWKSNEIQAVIDALVHSEPVMVAPGARRGRKPSASREV